MYESPTSLQDVCVDYICDNIEALCEVQTPQNEGPQGLVFKNEDVFLPPALAEQLLTTLSERNQLTDETMTVFDSRFTNLKRVKIRRSPLTTKGLRVLKTHRIMDLETIGLREITVNDLIGCLGEWSLSNLRALNVANSTFANGSKYCVVVSLSKLKHLQSLNVSSTEFREHGLDIVAEDLPCLECLDISSTPIRDLSALNKMKGRLKSLALYNLYASHSEELVGLLCGLTQLRHLDVSDDYSQQPFVNLQPHKFRVADLLSRSRCLPFLESLDISGKTGISLDLLRDFLSSHPRLSFLGLALTEACELPIFTDTENMEHRADIRVTGDATEQQVLESLRRYPTRALYVQRTLFHLFSFTQQFTSSRVDVIKLILPAMKSHPRELGVQMAATACLYNLSRAEMGTKVHPRWLGKIVNLTMSAMQNFQKHPQLQKNALLTLCSDRILQDVTFDRFRCAQLVMECLCSFDDPSMNRMSVAICGILAAKIPTQQTSLLGAKPLYMKKLLSIVDDKTHSQTVDITLKFTLSALWNLTDESPSTCEMFLDEKGLDLFMNVLEAFHEIVDENRTQVETKVLGLINNLAEVKFLRPRLMQEDIITMIKDLLGAKQIDVSYFAAGIVSHLVSDGVDNWLLERPSRRDMLNALHDAVLSWEQPSGEMVAYRSFQPFFPLLVHYDTPEVQLWAVWAMKHVCNKNGSRYCPMLVREGGAALLLQLVHSPNTHCDVCNLTLSVLDIMDKELGNSWRDNLLMETGEENVCFPTLTCS